MIVNKTISEALTQKHRWLVTGAAGFIGSNLCLSLLSLGQDVDAIDNFSTGHRKNIDEIEKFAETTSGSFKFYETDIRDASACKLRCQGIDFVLHQAALGSVPRSILTPLISHASNVDGFLNILDASRIAQVKRFVFASSSSVYGDEPNLPKVESKIGNCLSPYAATKRVNELYADVYSKTYGIECIGLRYFNVFGPRQDPNGAYAAVIPRWIEACIDQKPFIINGDGQTSRDFCFIDNVVQANILAAITSSSNSALQVYNVAAEAATTLLQLAELIQATVDSQLSRQPSTNISLEYRPFRDGDVRHSLADVSNAKKALGYFPSHDVKSGMREAVAWYSSVAVHK